LEFVRGIGYLMSNSKWRPRRTLQIVSWDAEEYGMVGSTEWVENHQDTLRTQVVAYVNVDYNSGKRFSARSSPILSNLIREEANKLTSPNYSNMTLLEEWNGVTSWTGTGADDSPFFHFLGVSTISTSFDNSIGVPGVYNSLYETNRLVNEFVDQGFTICTISAQINGLIALRLINDDVLVSTLRKRYLLSSPNILPSRHFPLFLHTINPSRVYNEPNSSQLSEHLKRLWIKSPFGQIPCLRK